MCAICHSGERLFPRTGDPPCPATDGDKLNELGGYDIDDLNIDMSATFAKTITEADIVLFAAAAGDNNALHINEEFARTTSQVESSPFGVLFGVQPWNFPYYQLARFAAPNLMAGNVVMVKHAGCVPQCAIAFEKLWLEAGAPVGAYTNLLISHDQVNRVIDDPRIKGVALTGSVEAGKIVAGKSRTKPQKVDDGTGRQRRLHRAGGCGLGQDGQMGGLGQNEQYWPVLRGREAFHCGRGVGRPLSRQVPSGAGRP